MAAKAPAQGEMIMLSYEGLPVRQFIRVSTEEQAKEGREGIGRQEESNRRTIENYKLQEVGPAIRIIDVSGTKVSKCREAHEILLPGLRNGKLKGIVLDEIDRLLRPDNYEDYVVLQWFRDSGALIFTKDGPIDVKNPTGFLMGGIKAAFAGWDLANIKSKAQGGKERRRIKGKHPNCQITLPTGVGYDRQADQFVLSEKIGDVREMFRLFVVEKWSQGSLGKKFGLSSRGVHVILRNPLYFGWRIYDEKRGEERYFKEGGRQSDRKRVQRNPEEIIAVRIFEQPPVSEGLFATAQAMLNRQFHEHTRRKNMLPDRFYYTGHLYCAACNEPMYSRGGETRGKQDYHLCKKNFYRYRPDFPGGCEAPYSNRQDLYDTLDRFVSEVLCDPKTLEQLIKAYIESKGRKTVLEGQIAKLRKEIGALGEKKARLLALYADSRYTKEELDRLVDGFNSRVVAKESTLKEAERDLLQSSRLPLKETLEAFASVFSGFRFLAPAEKRALIGKAGVDFFVFGNELRAFRFQLCHLSEPTPVRVSGARREGVPMPSARGAAVPVQALRAADGPHRHPGRDVVSGFQGLGGFHGVAVPGGRGAAGRDFGPGPREGAGRPRRPGRQVPGARRFPGGRGSQRASAAGRAQGPLRPRRGRHEARRGRLREDAAFGAQPRPGAQGRQDRRGPRRLRTDPAGALVRGAAIPPPGPAGEPTQERNDMMLATMMAAALAVTTPSWGTSRHEVSDKDHLWGLAGKYYSNSYCWRAIYNANKGVIKDPHWIYPRQVLEIPDSPKCESRAEALKMEVSAPVTVSAPIQASFPAAAPVETSAPAAIAAPAPVAATPVPAAAPEPVDLEPYKQEGEDDLPSDIPKGMTTQAVSSPRVEFPLGWKGDGKATMSGIGLEGNAFPKDFTAFGLPGKEFTGWLKDAGVPEGTKVTVYRESVPLEPDRRKKAVFVQKIGDAKVAKRLGKSQYSFLLLRSGSAVQENDILKVE